jgi:vacuolar iron transporter family protein
MTLSDSAELRSEATHPAIDPHASHVASRLNWLRAGVLGANDGIVSTAGLVVGVAAATTTSSAGLYAAKGLSVETARVVARELTDHDAFAAHIDVELGIDQDDLSSPWQAALSSAVAFTLGAVVPLIAILLPPVGARVPVAFLSVLIALVLTGTVSAILGGSRRGARFSVSYLAERSRCSLPTASGRWSERRFDPSE